MIKILSERKQRGFPQPDKVHFQKVHSQHQTYGESLDCFLRSGTRLWTFLSNIALGVADRIIR